MTPATTAPANPKTAEAKPTSRNPWLWVPSLHFSEGIPDVSKDKECVLHQGKIGSGMNGQSDTLILTWDGVDPATDARLPKGNYVVRWTVARRPPRVRRGGSE